MTTTKPEPTLSEFVAKIDFTNVMRLLRDEPRLIPKGTKVGIVVKRFHDHSVYREGMVVLFREASTYGDDYRNDVTITVEMPVTAEWAEMERGRGSLTRTIGTTVGVPRHYVKEVKGLLC